MIEALRFRLAQLCFVIALLFLVLTKLLDRDVHESGMIGLLSRPEE